jgi:uncharacterized protein (TIGR03066 family)
MRLIFGGALVLAMACGVTFAGQGKFEAKNLVGKWEAVPEKPDAKEKDKKDKAPAGPAMLVEFIPTDAKMPGVGKVEITVSDMGSDARTVGKYKLDGDKLSVEMKIGDKDVKDTLTVKKLTEFELTTEDSKKHSDTFRRKK